MRKKDRQSKLKKTQVEQILDKHHIPYQQRAFLSQQHQTTPKAMAEVDYGNLDRHLIYKTLVLKGNITGPLVGVVPLDRHLNEKALAKVSGNKKVEMVPLKALVKLTGYVHGANTPIGIYAKTQFPIFIDSEAKTVPLICVSAGQIGRSVQLNAVDLAQLVHATFARIQF